MTENYNAEGEKPPMPVTGEGETAKGGEANLYPTLPSAPPSSQEPPQYYVAVSETEVLGADVPPPPVYEPPEVQGILPPEQGTEQPGVQIQLPHLAYADFLPRMLRRGYSKAKPIFDDFKSLITFVNEWLLNNPQYQVIRCETVERKCAKSGEFDPDKTSYHTPSGGFADFVIILRLWLTPSPPGSQAMQIGYLNVVPKIDDHGGQTLDPTFEDINETVYKFNQWCETYPIPGRIITVETVRMRFRKKGMDTDIGFHSYEAGNSRLIISILRVFYARMEPMHEKIGTVEYLLSGVQDFVPTNTQMSQHENPKMEFETYTSTLQRAGTWIYNQKGIKVSNVQTMEVKMKIGAYERGKERLQVDSLATSHRDRDDEFSYYLKCIRVCYITSPMIAQANLPQMTLTSKCFLPARGAESERLSNLVQRINAWINLTGVKPFAVDTLKWEYNIHRKEQPSIEKCNHTQMPNKGHDWLNSIRLYFDGLFEEPAPQDLPKAQVKSSSCTVL